MKKIAVLVLVFLAAAPAFARVVDLTGWAVWIDPQSTNTFNSSTPNQPFDISFNGKLGWGAGLNLFFGHSLSLAVDGSEASPTAKYGFPGATLNDANLRMIPITGIVQLHFVPNGFIDPYVGAGAAYVLFQDIKNNADFGHVGVSQINFKNDAGLALNGGIGLKFSPRFGLTGDVKYVPVKASATAVFTSGPNQSQKIKINPVIASLGLTLHF